MSAGEAGTNRNVECCGARHIFQPNKFGGRIMAGKNDPPPPHIFLRTAAKDRRTHTLHHT